MHNQFDTVHAKFWQFKYALPITAAIALAVSQAFPIAVPLPWIRAGASFLFFAVCMVAQAVFVWRVLPETKGVSLEGNQKKLGIE